MQNKLWLAAMVSVFSLLATQRVTASPTQTLVDASHVLHEIQTIPARAVPRKLFDKAQGVAIIPGVIKAGFVLGARHGEGLVVAKNENGSWGYPLFLTITGGSIGWQAGAQSTDIILVFTTRRSLDGFLSGRKFTLGVDAAIAAGPVGRRAEAGTDIDLSAEIYSYSRSRGLFAGVSLGGSKLKINDTANAVFYQTQGVTVGQIMSGQLPALPREVFPFLQQLSAMTGAPMAAVPIMPGPAMQPGLPPIAPPQQQPAAPVMVNEVPNEQTATVDAAAEVLTEAMANPTRNIPLSLLKHAQAVAVFPGTIKAGLVVGGRFGRGVLVVRSDDGTGWSYPIFVTTMGGSVGWQIGAQASDIVLVFTNRRGVDDILRGKSITLGADVAVAAGPVGRQAEASTNLRLDAELYSYSRSKGLFAGLALEGGKMKVDEEAAAAYYRVESIAAPQILAGQIPFMPQSASRLAVCLIAPTAPPATDQYQIPAPPLVEETP